MNFFKTIRSSVYDPAFYSNLSETKTGGFGYYIKLSLLLAVLCAIWHSIVVMPQVRSALSDQNLETIVQYFPADLTLTIKNGVVSTNVQEPYIIPVPSNEVKPGTPKNLVVINTKITDIPTDVLKSNDTLSFIAKNAFVVNKNNTLQVVPTTQIPNMELNRASARAFMVEHIPFVRNLSLLIPFFIFFGLFVGYMFNLIPLLIVALVVWLVLKFMKKSAGYKHAYKVTLYAQTVSLVLTSITSGFPFEWTLTTLLTALIVYVNMKNSAQHEDITIVPTPTE